MRGVVFDIKEFAVHDGPGLRTTVFLKGCPLRCIWCHNPEGIKKFPELMFRESACIKCGRCLEKCSHEDCAPFGRCIHICPKGAISVSGKEYEPDELLFSILKNESIIKDGGVTFSGGEPLYQHEFLLEMLNLLNGRLPRAIETSGYSPSHIFERVINSVELVYMDIKIADDVLHKKYVGVSNDLILKNLEILRKSGRSVYAAALDKNAVRLDETVFEPGDTVVIGNEGHGLSERAVNACTKSLYVPMEEGSESLNAAVAAAVIMWSMYRN